MLEVTKCSDKSNGEPTTNPDSSHFLRELVSRVRDSLAKSGMTEEEMEEEEDGRKRRTGRLRLRQDEEG